VSPRDADCGVPLAARVPAMGHGRTFSHTLLMEANSTNARRSVPTGLPPTRQHALAPAGPKNSCRLAKGLNAC
jgi:hypothetical protein